MLFKYLGKKSVGCQDLIRDYLPTYGPQRKQRAFEAALEKHRTDDGEILVTHVMSNQAEMASAMYEKRPFTLTLDKGFYDYTKAREGEDTWFVNFADPTLFVAYDSDLFAQDEIQTLEMPLLAAFKKYVESRPIGGFAPLTNADGNPTPYLFKGVPYWISVNTSPVLRDGTVENIYGYRFMDASDEAIEAGIRTFEGNLRSNVLVISAPAGGYGRYSEEELTELMKTLICSFSAVREQAAGKVVIHAGNWGCGAFGGNRELMYLAQMYAASVCGIDELVMHDWKEEIGRAKTLYENMDKKMSFADVVAFLHSRKYEWGESDGN